LIASNLMIEHQRPGWLVKQRLFVQALAIKAAAESLDYACWDILLHAASINEIPPPSIRTMGQALGNQSRISGISRLLEIGALKTTYRQITPEFISENKDQSAEKLLKYQLQISDFSFLLAPRKPDFTRSGAISQNNLTLIIVTVLINSNK